MMSYRIEMNADANGTLLVTCPDLPEVTTFGVDVEDARRYALEAIEEAIAARIEAGVPLPQPKRHGAQRPVTLPLLTELKAQLYTIMKNDDVTRAELARKLDWHREQVDRLFRLDHASRVDQIEAAFKALAGASRSVVFVEPRPRSFDHQGRGAARCALFSLSEPAKRQPRQSRPTPPVEPIAPRCAVCRVSRARVRRRSHALARSRDRNLPG